MTTGLKGRDFILKRGDGSPTEVFAAVGGIRVNRFSKNNNPVDITNMSSAGWQEMLGDGGTQMVSISAEGVSDNNTAWKALLADAFARTERNFELVSGLTSEKFAGKFVIASFERTGSHDGAETFSIELTSDGAITYTPPA